MCVCLEESGSMTKSSQIYSSMCCFLAEKNCSFFIEGNLDRIKRSLVKLISKSLS